MFIAYFAMKKELEDYRDIIRILEVITGYNEGLQFSKVPANEISSYAEHAYNTRYTLDGRPALSLEAMKEAAEHMYLFQSQNIAKESEEKIQELLKSGQKAKAQLNIIYQDEKTNIECWIFWVTA